MSELEYILNKYDIEVGKEAEIDIPNVGRNDLAKLFAELGYTTGVEIGVKEGDYSEVLCQSNPELHLYSIDPWLLRADYTDGRGQGTFDNYEKVARDKLSKYDCEILKMKSSEAVDQFVDDSLDFVYIDGHHDFFNTTFDIFAWGKKVRSGGIISGHDFVPYKAKWRNAVFHVVNAWTDAHEINPWFVLGLKYAPEGTIRDRHRSWFWVKE